MSDDYTDLEARLRAKERPYKDCAEAADAIAALRAGRDEHGATLRNVIEERDRTFALMLARAEAAEAALAGARAAPVSSCCIEDIPGGEPCGPFNDMAAERDIERARAEAAEAALADARAALEIARIDMEGWGGYADDYFKEKWDLAGDLAKIDAALARTAPKGGSNE